MKKTILAAMIAAAFATVGTAQAADWSDTEVQYLYGSQFRDNGGKATEFSKNIITLQHASGYKYGRNFFFVDFAKSGNGDGNAFDVYGEYYHTLSYSKVGGVDWSKNFVKDVGLTTGFNLGTKNSEFRPNPKVLLVGPTIDFNVPGFAFFNVDLLAYRDVGTFSGFGGGNLCGKQKTTYQITPVWNLPFSIGPAKFSFEGFMDIIGSHGTCATQVLTQPQLRWDVGNHFGKPGTVFLGVEYQYWDNKFGGKQRNESFPQLLLAWKL